MFNSNNNNNSNSNINLNSMNRNNNKCMTKYSKNIMDLQLKVLLKWEMTIIRKCMNPVP